MMDAIAMPKDMMKRKEAMKKRLASLGKNNPVVQKAMKMQDPPEEDMKWKHWQMVDELVSAARREYFDKEGGDMNKCVGHLAEALSKLASQKGIDKGKSKHNNDEDDDDY